MRVSTFLIRVLTISLHLELKSVVSSSKSTVISMRLELTSESTAFLGRLARGWLSRERVKTC